MTLLQDLRFAIRILVKDPWFTLVAVLALGLGIGVNSTVFTFVNAVLLRGLPFENAQEIMHLNSRNSADGNGQRVSYPDFQDWRAQSKAFASLAAYQEVTMNVSDSGHPPERTSGVSVSANAFAILRQGPVLGRDFRDGEDRQGAESVAIIGYGLWKSRYGRDPNIIGRLVTVNEIPTTIIGVMPEGFRFPVSADMWQPLVSNADMLRRDEHGLGVFGRLAAGHTAKDARAEMTGIARRLRQQYPDTNKTVDDVEVLTFNDRFNGGEIKIVFLALMGAVGFVLLIACANVANLLLSRSARRSREIAVRVALGASRGRVIRQLLVESTLVAFLGGIVGLGLSLVGVRLFDMAVADVGKPYWIQFTMDGTGFAYLVAVCLATGVIFGLAPALQVSKTNLNEILKEGGRGNAGGARARWLSSTMVVVELALTLVLLVGAGLMVRSFMKLYSLDLGFETSRLLTLQMEMSEHKYKTVAQRRVFYESLIPRLDAIPGVAASALASAPPLMGGSGRRPEIEGRPLDDPAKTPDATMLLVSDRYFDTLGVAVQRGHALRDTDGKPGSEGTVISARFAERYFPGEDPLGKRIRFQATREGQKPGPWLTIVGVSPTIRQRDPQDPQPDAVAYVSYRLESPSDLTILVRGQGDAASLIAPIRQAVQAIDPNQPVFGVQTMTQLLAQRRWAWRVFGSLFAILAGIALVLSTVGIYAVTAYAVTQRTQEIGVRMALGAQPGQVSWLILRQGLLQLAIGLGIGLGAALLLSRVLKALMVQIDPTDPPTFIAICTLLGVIAVAATVIPSRRATRLDPLAALRVE